MLMLYLGLLETEEDKSRAERLYYRYRKLMKYIALQVLEQEDTAEDAVHDAMLRLMENLHCIREEGSREEKAFVVIVTKNVARDLLQKEKYRAAEDITEYLHRLHGRGSVSETAYVNELLERIYALPEILRDPLEMSAYLGLNSRQIARILNISEATVRKRIQRARNYLKQEEEVLL